MATTETKVFCNSCERFLEPKEFYPNYNRFHTKKLMHYCKDCSKEIADEIFTLNSNHEVCVRNMCNIFHMPFYYEAMEIFDDKINKGIQTRDVNYVFKYLQSLKEMNCPPEAWNDLSTGSLFGVDILKIAHPTADGDVNLLQSLEDDWGKRTLKEYHWLEKKFAEYSKGEDLSVSMRNTMRYLCLAELEVKKLKDNNEDSKSAEERVMKYYKSLKLDNFQLKEGKSVGERTLEKWTAIEETTHPAEVAPELFKDDICGLKKEYHEMLRCVRNAKDGAEIFPDDLNMDL
ncbi:MAG: hypothetical protein KBT06_11520 [Prevotellaceae bacterium]|nr:hypothetical protein [Candidatus Colivivens equi]